MKVVLSSLGAKETWNFTFGCGSVSLEPAGFLVECYGTRPSQDSRLDRGITQFFRQLTTDSELFRTRGIRLFN